MKILSVKNRRKHITAVELEDGTELLLDTELAEFWDLKPDAVIDDPDVLLYESDLKRAKSRALWYLSRGDHSEKALYEKLRQAGFSEASSSAAVLRMIELDLVNDQRYAERLSEYLAASGSSKREIFAKMMNKGIPSAIAKECAFSDGEDETEKIKHLLETKYASKLSTEEGVQKVFAALIRKGFSFSDVKDALKAYSEELYYSED